MLYHQKLLLFFCSIILLVLGAPTVSVASCRAPTLNNFSRGMFKVEKVEKAKLRCNVLDNNKESTQEGPGCFLKLRKIDAFEKDLNQERELTIYSSGKRCNEVAGQQLRLHLNSWCCNEHFANPTCGTITNATRYCANGLIFQEMKDSVVVVDRIRKQLKDRRLSDGPK